ncbi:MAG: hypothetical protein ILO53_06640 [Clostridia bacterium]|nr:hypothetical protein [Clostridia bacterium]
MNDVQFMAGASIQDVTPPVGTLLYGYVPDSVSTSVHDRLEAGTVAFRQDGRTALLISLTVGDLGTELADELRAVLGRETGVDADCILINATHTHSAPNVSGMEGWGDIDRPYVDGILIPALTRSAREALGDLQPAEIAVATVRSEVGINRRQQLPNGVIVLGQNPWGCFDPTMTLAALRNSDTKRGIVNIIHYGCHGTAAGNNREITRDWSGVMIDALTEASGTPSVFVNGAIGDVGPRLSNGFTTGDIHLVEELGAVAAGDALRAYDLIKTQAEYKPGRFSAARGKLEIPRKPLPTRTDAQESILRFQDPDNLINVARLEYAHFRAVLDEYEAGEPPYDPSFVFPMTVLSLGEIVFVPFPFEIFSEMCLRLKNYSPFPHTLSLSNTNGYCAYLPTQDQLVRGGYEVDCFKYNGAHPLADNSDQIVIDESMALIAQAFQDSGRAN